MHDNERQRDERAAWWRLAVGAAIAVINLVAALLRHIR